MPDELLDSLSVAQRAEMWRGITGQEGSDVYVAVDDGLLVGFCAVVTPSRDDDAQGDVAEIVAIYVDPDVWRNGVGRALMDVAFAELRAGAWRWVTLWVLAANRQARDFYARFGLRPDGAETTDADSGATEVRLRGPVTA
jgi:GNAT superfamily N-acetyltransferase